MCPGAKGFHLREGSFLTAWPMQRPGVEGAQMVSRGPQS